MYTMFFGKVLINQRTLFDVTAIVNISDAIGNEDTNVTDEDRSAPHNSRALVKNDLCTCVVRLLSKFSS